MTPVELSRTVLHAVRRAVDDGELSVAVPERAVVSEPGPGGCGDFATTIALQLARPAGQPPLRVAEILRPRLAETAGIRDVVVTGPGFLNISLDAQADPVVGLVREIREKGTRYGHGDALAGQVVALRVPYEVRAEVVADAVVRMVGTQGGRATVMHGEPVNLRPVPAPEDPAPLGHDAAQWALLHPAPHDRPRITADHLVQRESNPLFRVRYAHARIRSLSRNAVRLGFTAEPGPIAHPAATGPGTITESDAPNSGPITRPAATSPGTITRPGAPNSGPTPASPSSTPTGPRPTSAGPGATPNAPGATSDAESATPDAPGATSDAESATPDAPGATSDAQSATPDAPDATSDAQGPTPTAPRPTPPVRPLLTPLADHPRVLTVAATHRAPDRLARHLVTVADAVLPLLPFVLPVGEEKPSAAHRARLALAEAAGTVLAGGLSLLGIDAPEHL